MWTWVAAQSSAALFSQLLAAGAVPPPLAPVFAGVAALQFVSVALAPQCYASIPFQSFWSCAGLVVGACAGVGVNGGVGPAVRPCKEGEVFSDAQLQIEGCGSASTQGWVRTVVK